MKRKPTATAGVAVFTVPNGGKYATRVADVRAVHQAKKPDETAWTVTLETARTTYVVVAQPFEDACSIVFGGKPGDYK